MRVVKMFHRLGRSNENFLSVIIEVVFRFPSDTAGQQSFMNTPAGKFGAVAVLSIAACMSFDLAGYSPPVIII